MMHQPKIGIVYVNTKHDDMIYIREAEASAFSFRRYLPHADYLLYTDACEYESHAFTHIQIIEFSIPEALKHTDHKNGQMAAKLKILAESPYDYTLFLGSDVYALKDEAASIFDVLEYFDLAAAHAPHRVNSDIKEKRYDDIPACFPEFNCDLVLFKKSPKIKRFLYNWRDAYLEQKFPHAHDQGPFRQLVFSSDLRIATLPPEYNYRGNEYRSDTIILQNREKLKDYLMDIKREEEGFIIRKINRLLRKCNSIYRMVRKQ